MCVRLLKQGGAKTGSIIIIAYKDFIHHTLYIFRDVVAYLFQIVYIRFIVESLLIIILCIAATIGYYASRQIVTKEKRAIF